MATEEVEMATTEEVPETEVTFLFILEWFQNTMGATKKNCTKSYFRNCPNFSKCLDEKWNHQLNWAHLFLWLVETIDKSHTCIFQGM